MVVLLFKDKSIADEVGGIGLAASALPAISQQGRTW
jgi:hypothetical protein